jgi:MoxR-like ATPase
MTTPAQAFNDQLQERLGAVLFGMAPVIHGLSLALIAKGHVLLQGVPGIGKTLLAKTLAAQLGGHFSRIQCTADLMPSDMTGIHVFHPEQRRFELMHGPLFADVVLVDEINRTGPKTQSALLQAMEEASISIDRQTYPLSDNFFVIATQNPQDYEGTYPLPESQLDRFLLRLDIGYPPPNEEQRVLRAYDRPDGGHRDASAASALPQDLLTQARAHAAEVHVADAVYNYVTEIATASRTHAQVSLGLSTRGALGLMRCARVEAALRGGAFVTPDDVKAVARPVMAHRLMLTPEAQLEGVDTGAMTDSILGQVSVPRGDA